MVEILVMGGTEFVSSSIAKYLIGKGYAVDIFTRGIKPIKFEGVRNHLKGDRKSSEDLEAVLSDRQYDYVFDISAYTKGDVESLINILNKDRLKKYIFCSSGAVYNSTTERIKEDFPRGENHVWGTYGYDKKAAEDYLFSKWESEKLPIVIFRPTYIYGENNNLYRESFLFDRITEERSIPIPYGNNTRTQFIHISDLVKVFESAMFCDKVSGQAYNVTHPEIVSWEDWVKSGFDVTGKSIDIKRVNMKEADIRDREFFPFRDVTYYLATDKSAKDGLYMPELNLREGMEQTYQWYLEVKPKLIDRRMTKVEVALSLK